MAASQGAVRTKQFPLRGTLQACRALWLETRETTRHVPPDLHAPVPWKLTGALMNFQNRKGQAKRGQIRQLLNAISELEDRNDEQVSIQHSLE